MQIIIASPPYDEKSEGIKVLHFLSHSFNSLGYKSKILLINTSDPTFQKFISGNQKLGLNPEYLTDSVKSSNEVDLQKDIVIYPEIISNNPANAKNVVRYFLNKPGNIFGNKIDIQPRDFLLSYQNIFFPKANFSLYFPLIDLTKIPTRQSIQELPKNLQLTFIGKGKKYGACTRVPNSISLDWDKSYEEYVLLLKNARYLFTWDGMTGVNFDAVVHGCIPVLMSMRPWTEDEMKLQEVRLPMLSIDQYTDNNNYTENYENFLNQRDECLENIEHMQKLWPEKIHSLVMQLKQHFK